MVQKQTKFLKSSFIFFIYIIVTLIVSIILSLTYHKIASANTQYSLNQFTIGISNDVSWDNNNIGATSNSPLIAGPWVLDGWKNYHQTWLSKFNLPDNITKTPYIYTYVIAGKARADQGIMDCNVSNTNNLCQKGAQYLRDNYNSITTEYTNLAQQIKNTYGNQRQIYIHLEPDFYQYGDSNSPQQGGVLTPSQAHQIMNSWTSAIKSVLPNAKLVMDVSPWNPILQSWSSGFTNFDFAGLVGKRFGPNGDGSVHAGIDGKTYKQMSIDTGKKLILNDAHGPGGYFLNYNYEWDNDQVILDRLKDGVVALLLPPNDLNHTFNLIQRVSAPIITQDTYFNIKVLLEGALINNNGTYGTEMRNIVSAYNSSINNNYVDEVSITLLDSNKNILETISVFINPVGELINRNTLTKNIKFTPTINSGMYFFNIKHRNHIGIGSNTPISITSGAINSIDFTVNNNTKFNNQKQLPNGKFAMKLGDVTSDGVRNSNDRNIIGGSSSAINTYTNSDVNLDGIVNSTDRNLVINSNSIVAYLN